MQGLIYFQSASSGYIPLTQSHMNYEDELNKNRKSATTKKGEWRCTCRHSKSSAWSMMYFLWWDWQYVEKWKSCIEPISTKLADKTNLTFSSGSPTYYIITAFPGYIVPITHR